MTYPNTPCNHTGCTPAKCNQYSLAPLIVQDAQLHWYPDGEEYERAAEAAAAARKRFSEAWLLYKARKDVTDGQATHQAYVECGVERDMAEARLEVARARLTR